MSQPTEHDEIMQEISAFLRTALGAASRLAEQRARTREQQLRDAEARGRTDRDQLDRRIVAQQKIVDAQLRQVYRPQWWESTTPTEQATAYRAASEWQTRSPAAVAAALHMQHEFRLRYGIEVPDTVGDDPAITDLLTRARDEQATGRQESAREAADRRLARDLLRDADREDRQARIADAAIEQSTAMQPASGHQAGTASRSPVLAADEGPSIPAPVARAVADSFRRHGEVAYDSVDRRAATAQALADVGIEDEALAARMAADQDQARPAADAVTTTPGPSPKARKTRRPGQNRSRQTDRGR